MQDATDFSTAAQVESVKLSPSGVFCASSSPSWAVLGPQASEDLAVGLASACLRRQDEFPLPTGSSASGWLGRSTLPADTPGPSPSASSQPRQRTLPPLCALILSPNLPFVFRNKPKHLILPSYSLSVPSLYSTPA